MNADVFRADVVLKTEGERVLSSIMLVFPQKVAVIWTFLANYKCPLLGKHIEE